MLLGVTFAWLTDSVVTTNNLIVAGNLDVEMYYAKAVDANGNVITDVSQLDWQVVELDTNVFRSE
jgi:predicted ribosomally synthesized peptide with SipW-like signal peptide